MNCGKHRRRFIRFCCPFYSISFSFRYSIAIISSYFINFRSFVLSNFFIHLLEQETEAKDRLAESVQEIKRNWSIYEKRTEMVRITVNKRKTLVT